VPLGANTVPVIVVAGSPMRSQSVTWHESPVQPPGPLTQ
jgi:hypothetical protein